MRCKQREAQTPTRMSRVKTTRSQNPEAKSLNIKSRVAVFKLRTLFAHYKLIVQIWCSCDTMGYWRCWHGIHEVMGSNPCAHSSLDDTTCPCLPWLLNMWPYFEGIIFEWTDHKLETLLFIYSFTGYLSRPWITLSTYRTYSGLGDAIPSLTRTREPMKHIDNWYRHMVSEGGKSSQAHLSASSEANLHDKEGFFPLAQIEQKTTWSTRWWYEWQQGRYVQQGTYCFL